MSSDDEDFDAIDEIKVTTASQVKQRKVQERKEKLQSAAQQEKSQETDQKFTILRARIEHEKKQEEEIARLARSGTRESAFQLRKRLMSKRRKALYLKLNEEQRERYIHYMNSHFPKSIIKKLMVNVLGTTKVSDPFALMMGGITKVFVGDLIENALLAMHENNEQGPIRLIHIREAHRRLNAKGLVPNSVHRLGLKRG